MNLYQLHTASKNTINKMDMSMLKGKRMHIRRLIVMGSD